MREAFQKELDVLAEQLADLAELAETAMTDATAALLDADLAIAELRRPRGLDRSPGRVPCKWSAAGADTVTASLLAQRPSVGGSFEPARQASHSA